MARARGKTGQFIKSGKKSGKKKGKGGGCGKDTCTCGTGGKKVYEGTVAKGGVVDTITMSTGLMDAFDAIELDLVSKPPKMKRLDELLKLFIMYFARKLCGFATGTGGGGAMGGSWPNVGTFITGAACIPLPTAFMTCPAAIAAHAVDEATGSHGATATANAATNKAVAACESLMDTIADKLVGLIADYIEGADEKLIQGLEKLQQAGDVGQGAAGEVQKILGVIRGVLEGAPLMLMTISPEAASKVGPVVGQALEVLDKVEPAIAAFASGDMVQLRAIIEDLVQSLRGRGGAISHVGNQFASPSEVNQKPIRSSTSALTYAAQGFPTGSQIGQAASHGTYAINAAGNIMLRAEDAAQAFGISAANTYKTPIMNAAQELANFF